MKKSEYGILGRRSDSHESDESPSGTASGPDGCLVSLSYLNWARATHNLLMQAKVGTDLRRDQGYNYPNGAKGQMTASLVILWFSENETGKMARTASFYHHHF